MNRQEKIRSLGEASAGRLWLARDRLRGGGVIALKELSEASRGREDPPEEEFTTPAGRGV